MSGAHIPSLTPLHSGQIGQPAPGPGHSSAGTRAARSIVEAHVAALVEAPGDPRTYSRANVSKATAIVRPVGPVLPLLLDADGLVIAGRLGVLPLQRLGIDSVPASRMEDLSGPTARELSLALNRFLELGHFDAKKLGALVLEIEAAIPDFSTLEIGFEATEIDLAVAALDEGEAETLPTLQSRAVTPEGRIWQLGRHRVGYGDPTCPATIARLADDMSVATMLADPPYGCRVEGFVTSRAHREFVQG